MKTYKITVTDNFFPELSAEIDAESEQQAIAIAKDHYAMELDTTEDYIEIVSVEEL